MKDIPTYKISDLIMSQNFQGLYAGSPYPEDKEAMKTRVLEKIGHLHPDNFSYEDWTDDFTAKPLKSFRTYGNIVLAVIDFDKDVDENRNADWSCVNIMFIYYPLLGETIEGKIKELLETKIYATHECNY
jgi:hypothetical protein